MVKSERLRVVEVGADLAGSVCSRLFAFLGHDVIRCEPAGGDLSRTRQPVGRSGLSLAFTAVNSGKTHTVIDPGPSGRRRVHDLLKGADIAVLGTAARTELQMDPEALRRDFPDLIAVWITGFGLEGDEAELPADSLLAESLGGLATMIGEADRRPLSLGGEQAAYGAGITGFLGGMLGLCRRDAGRGGDLVEVAMCDVVAYMDWKSDLGLALHGRVPRRSGANPGDWRLVRTRDGWVGFIFQSKHWSELVEMIDAPELRDPELQDELNRVARADEWWPAVERWARERAAETIYALAQARGLPFGWVAGPSDLVTAAQFRARGFVNTDCDANTPAVRGPLPAPLPAVRGAAPARRTVTPELDAVPGVRCATPARPLAGVIALDFGTITSGAAATRLLADYGATVIKVEWVDRPDVFRSWKMPADAEGVQAIDSPYFPSNNVGKLALAVNLKTDEGREIVHRLVRRSHVLVENYRVGVAARLGIDAETMHRVNPDLLYLSLSSQGQTGPEAMNSSYGSTLDLTSGLASLTGYGPDQPLWSSSDVNYPDQLVSLVGAAFLTYCLQQGISGVQLDISQREVVSWTLGAEIADFLENARNAQPTGNRRPGRTPRDTYPCRGTDRWVAISCGSDAERRALARCLGAAELAGKDEGWWVANADAVDARVAEWTVQRDRADAVDALRAAGVPAVPVLDAEDRAGEARFGEREVISWDDGLPVKGVPLLMHEHRVRRRLEAPRLGEHTRRVLREFADVSDSEIDDLEMRSIVFCAPAVMDRGPS